MDPWKLDNLINILNKSGKMALEYWNTVEVSLKTDGSVVTEADKAIESFLFKELTAIDKNSFFIGEETLNKKDEEYLDKALNKTTWIVDPIDGTSPYSSGLPQWGISIGLMEEGILTNGAIFLVPLGEFFITNGKEILYTKANIGEEIKKENLKPIIKRDCPINSTSILNFSRIWNKKDISEIKNPVHSVGSSVFSLMKLLQGCYLGSVTRFCLWDGAAAFPILARANFHYEFINGQPFSLEVNKSNYILEKGIPGRWLLKNALIISATKEGLNYIKQESLKANILN